MRNIPVNRRNNAAYFIAILIGSLILISSCSELEQEYIRKDKFFRMAQWEDVRSKDMMLVDSTYLGDPDPEIRARAALAIGRIGNGLYNEKFIEMLPDSSTIAAEAKFFAAGLIGDSSFFEPIFELIQSGTPAMPAAVEALGRIADSTQSPRLKVFLNHPDTMVVYQAMLAMFRAEEYSESERMAKIGLTTQSRKVKYGALYSLARGSRAEGRELFKSLLSDPDPEYRMLAYDGLGRSADTSSISIIATGLNDTDYRVAASAVYSLNRFGKMGVEYIASKLPEFNDEKLVILCVEILGRTENLKNAGNIIENIFKNDSRENVRAAAARSLLQIKGAESLFLIDEIIKEPTTYQRAAIAEGITDIDKDAAMARLATFRNDDSPLVRMTALEGLCEIDSAGCKKYIEAGLKDEDFIVQYDAVTIASERGFTEYIPEIMNLYISNRGTINDDIKQAIIQACSTFVSDPAYDSLMIEVLEEGSNDESFYLRDIASRILLAKYDIDKTESIGYYSTRIENKNYSDLFEKYDSNPVAEIETPRGIIKIELLYKDAPKTVNNFITLAENKYYDSLIFHRVVPNFVIQDGCPRRDGMGGPGYTIRCEYSRLSYETGTVGMAHAGKDTGGSQYFITLSPQPHLDGRYTIFGRVISGMDVAQQIVRGDRINSVKIIYSEE